MLSLLGCSLEGGIYRLFGLLLSLILKPMSVLSMTLNVGLAIYITEFMELNPRKSTESYNSYCAQGNISS